LTAPSGVKSRTIRSLRPVGQIAGFYIVTFVALALLEALILFLPGIRTRLNTGDIAFQWVSLASVVIATWVALWSEKLPWSAVGLDRNAASPKLLLKGAAFGALTIGIASLVLLGTHMLQIVPTMEGDWFAEAGRTTALLLPAAFFEELFIRGYVFAVLRRAAGWKTALVVTSIVFGLLHAANPGADGESILAVIVAGFFLGAIFLYTRSLYAAGVAHFAWNWIMAGALHIAVSGIPSRDPDYKVIETGPDWLTGGPWGPEGGAAAVVAMFIVVFYLYGRHQRRGEWNWGRA
jgi:hypothetical protein